MEKGQSEVTNKIRSAIKKKLAEISDFVDDELPEYIMILIANQRSKTQIEKDLSLFLRNDTVNFTNWLWDLLNSLKSGSKSSSSLPKSESNVSKQKEAEIDEDAIVLDFDPDERETDFLNEDTNDSLKSKTSVPLSTVLESETARGSTASKSLNYKLIEKEKASSRSLSKVRKSSLKQYSKEPLSSAVIPVRKKIFTSDEYDPVKPEYERSSYTPSSRKYGGPAALQANKLLLKAVDDATKSILEGKNVEDNYKPTPIKVLTSKQYCNPLGYKDDSMQKKSNSFQDISVLSQPKLTSDLSTEFKFLNSEYESDILFEKDRKNYPVSTQRSRTICLKEIPLVSHSPDVKQEEYIHPFTYLEDLKEVRPKSPHFIVTLDGISSFSLKRKLEDNTDESMVEDDDGTIFSDELVTSPEKRLKLNERCKYWPACKNSDNCAYHHPTIPCKCFPDCKFGDKCLYIHPNCKFDALCSRKDCPFTHASKRKLPLIALPVKMIPVKSRKIKPVCKFYPKCTSKHCQFMHPKLCRYGTECRLPACLFSHFPIPSRSQLKWQATIS